MFLLVIYASIRTASSSQVGKLALASRASTGGTSEATTLREGGEASDVNLMEEGSRQQVRPEKLPCEFGMGEGGRGGVKSLACAKPFPVTFPNPVVDMAEISSCILSQTSRSPQIQISFHWPIFLYCWYCVIQCKTLASLAWTAWKPYLHIQCTHID